jgi:hypothetical protein
MESSEDILWVGIRDGEQLGRRETRLSDSMIVGNRSFLKPNWVELRSYDDGRGGLRTMVGCIGRLAKF